MLLSTTVVMGALMLNACGGDDQSVDDANVTDVELTPASEGSTDEPSDAPANEPSEDASDRPDVTPPADLPNELVITDIIDGTGPAVAAGDTVWVDYTGIRSEDGVEFDNSYDRGEPFRFTVGQGSVIDGWDQGLIGASAGAQRRQRRARPPGDRGLRRVCDQRQLPRRFHRLRDLDDHYFHTAIFGIDLIATNHL